MAAATTQLKWKRGACARWVAYAAWRGGMAYIEQYDGGYDASVGATVGPLFPSLREAQEWCEREVEAQEAVLRRSQRACPHCGGILP